MDVDEGDYVSTYGRLYNGYTAADERRLCPNAWSVPTDEDWMELEMALGMSESEQTPLAGAERIKASR